MEFFDKLGKKASEAYKVTADKTGKLAKEAKLKMKMNELKSEINDIYKDIGKAVYENYVREEKQDISKDLDEKCTKINCLSDEIESYLKECLELKDKKKCPNCYVQIEKDVKFCPECGAKQEFREEEPAKEVEIVDKPNERKDDDNSDKTENNKKDKSKKSNNKNNDNKDNSKDKSNLEKTVEVEADVNLEDDITVEHLEVEDEQDD